MNSANPRCRVIDDIVAQLLSKELKKREASLSSIAKAVENDKSLNKEMAAWNKTLSDGMDNWEWK
jgi:hypothetical protein